MEAGSLSRRKAGLLALLLAGGIAVMMMLSGLTSGGFTGVSSAGAVTDFTNVPKCPGIPGCRKSLDQRAGWEGWVLNYPSGCAARTMKPYLTSEKQVKGWTEVFCRQDTKLTVRSRLFANYQFADLMVDQKGCIGKASCVRNVPRGFSYYPLACPKSGEILPNRLYYTDVIFYKGTKLSTASGGQGTGINGTTRSRDARLSPYCAF
jgi:hypothetical protein